VIVCITQLLKDRQLAELIEAARGCPDVWVIVGGKGVLAPAIEKWTATIPRMRYIGFVRGNDIPAYTCASDVVYYGFDPSNPNARFSAPNKLFEALAAGKPLITGDFGEIAEVVRQAHCGIVLPEYTVASVQSALERFRDVTFRRRMADNARRFGASSMNWAKGEERLHHEYSALLPSKTLSLRYRVRPSSTGEAGAFTG
jgi:glycosyltransferase involved in cell wall biosynthesis